MPRAHNIANTLTHFTGTIHAPSAIRRRGWGWVILLAAILLLAGSRYACAQNSSSEPYINSTHLYRVPMGDYNNTVGWEISNPNYNGGASVTLGSQAWIAGSGKFERTSPQRDSAYIEIEFVESVFTSSGTIIGDAWRLVYSETNSSGGCIARRYFDIYPEENQFNLTVQAYASDCNSLTGEVWDNGWGDLSELSDTMSVTLGVVMTKATDHVVREWSFTATVSPGTGFTLPADPTVFIPLVNRSGTSSSNGAFSITGVSGAGFTMLVELDTDDPLYDVNGDVVEFDVYIIGAPTADAEVTLTIAGGQGVSGTDYNVVTDENDTTDNEGTRTLYGIPNTSIVSASP